MKVGIIGHAAIGKDYYDGQTISTRTWIEEFKKSKKISDVKVVDTFNYKKRPIQIISNFMACIFSCDAIIILLSGNGLKFFLPLLYYSNKILRRKIFNRAIGGNLDEFIIRNPRYVRYLNALKVNWVQSNRLVEKINALGVTNGMYLENFRDTTPVRYEETQVDVSLPYKFCTFCRVSKAKGITDAIEAIAKINKDAGSIIAALDVYGPLEAEYKEEFEALIQIHSDCVRYMGSVDSKEAVNTLKKYYMHLFPTRWRGEGFPGTLIDCYNAALPTIASDWAYNTEFIIPGKTGFIYHWDKPEELATEIKKAIDLPADEYKAMRLNNLKEASKYTSDYVMEKVMDRIFN